MAKESDGFVRAISRGFAVIEALGRPPGRHTLSEIAVASELSRATARRVLATLVAMAYCEPDGRYFRLRPRALGLGLSYLTALPFWAPAQRTLEELRNAIGESCALAVLDGAEIVYVLRLPAKRILSANLSIGSRLPAHLVSLGRVLLAGLPAEARETHLDRIAFERRTPRTIADRVALDRELDRVAGQGYAWIDGELDPSICGIAVPIRDQSRGVVAAISISMISGTIEEEAAKARYLVPLRRAAEEIRAQTAAG
jgi:IclR family transcriptional regulator, pca regulon regulatory protein